MREEIAKLFPEEMLYTDALPIANHIENLLQKNEKLEKSMKDIKQHIKDKVRKSLEYDWGIGGRSSDRLFTETVVELQLIESMIDKALGE